MATRSDDTKGVRACVLLSDTSVSEEDVSQKKTKKLKGKKKKGASVTSSGDAIISFAPVRTPPAAFVRKAVAKATNPGRKSKIAEVRCVMITYFITALSTCCFLLQSLPSTPKSDDVNDKRRVSFGLDRNTAQSTKGRLSVVTSHFYPSLVLCQQPSNSFYFFLFVMLRFIYFTL